MSVACLLLTHFPVKFELLRHPELQGRPFLIVGKDGRHSLVVARSLEAKSVDAGTAVDHAVALCPDATLIEADTQAYREAWNKTLDALERRAPIVEDADMGLAYVSTAGLGLLYGSDANLVHALLSTAPAPFNPRVGVATGKFPAMVAALKAQAGNAFRVLDGAERFLAPLPVRLLPTSLAVKERLVGFGLNTLGNVVSVGFGKMQAQFGREGARLWLLANGIDDTPINPRVHEKTFSCSLSFPAPTASLQAILIAAEDLLRRAFHSQDLQGRHVRRGQLSGDVDGGVPWVKALPFREPVSVPADAMRLVRYSFENISLPGPLLNLSLTLTGVTGEAGKQASLFPEVRALEQLDEELRQYKARHGEPAPIYQYREVDTWSRLPERRNALIPYVP